MFLAEIILPITYNIQLKNEKWYKKMNFLIFLVFFLKFSVDFLKFLVYFKLMGINIKAFRERVGYKTQMALAKELGIGTANVSEWELGKGRPSYAILEKLLELGATVEELFGFEYNEKQRLVKAEAITTAGGSLQMPTKLDDFEANLLEKIIDVYGNFDGELESIKVWTEVYKLEKEIERGGNIADLDAKKQKLQELREQIEEEFVWSERFEARETIKTCESELEDMEKTERHYSYEKIDMVRRILYSQDRIKREMYSYVNREMSKLGEQKATKEKVARWRLERQIQEQQEFIKLADNATKIDAGKLHLQKLQVQLANTCFNIAKECLEKQNVEKKDIEKHFEMLDKHYLILVNIEKKLDIADIEHLNVLNNFIEKKYTRSYFAVEGDEGDYIYFGFYYTIEMFVNYCYEREMKENGEGQYFDKAIEVMNNLENKIRSRNFTLSKYRAAFIDTLEQFGDSSALARDVHRQNLLLMQNRKLNV